MIDKIEQPAYENNVKKLNEIIDKVNSLDESGTGSGQNSDEYLPLTGGTMSGSITMSNNASIILPGGIEIF